MNKVDFNKLQPGDAVRHKGGGDVFLVTANYGGRVTAVRTADITNPDEWDIVIKRSAMGGIVSPETVVHLNTHKCDLPIVSLKPEVTITIDAPNLSERETVEIAKRILENYFSGRQ